MTTQPTQAQLDYESDCRDRPNYHDGAPRPAWAELRPIAQYSWSRGTDISPHLRSYTERL